MRSLRGLAESWESTDSIRLRVRDKTGSIFRKHGGGGLPHANVKQCGIYSDVMTPLVKIVAGWWRTLQKSGQSFRSSKYSLSIQHAPEISSVVFNHPAHDC